MTEKTYLDKTTRGLIMSRILDFTSRSLRKIGPPAALLTFLLLSKAGIDWFSKLDPMFEPPIQTPALPTGTATLPSTSTSESIIKIINTPMPSNEDIPSNCTEILPGQYTWNVAQSIGDPSTIYDYDLYGIGYPDGEYIGTIIPGQWDVKTSTENQKKLRRQLPGAVVCAVNPR